MAHVLRLVVVEPVVLLVRVRPRPKRHQQRRVRDVPLRSALSETDPGSASCRGRSRGRSRSSSTSPCRSEGVSGSSHGCATPRRGLSTPKHAASSPRSTAAYFSDSRVSGWKHSLGMASRSARSAGTGPLPPPRGVLHGGHEMHPPAARKSPRGGPISGTTTTTTRRPRRPRGAVVSRRRDRARASSSSARRRTHDGLAVANIARAVPIKSLTRWRSRMRWEALCSARVALRRRARADPFYDLSPSADVFGRGQPTDGASAGAKWRDPLSKRRARLSDDEETSPRIEAHLVPPRTRTLARA